MPNDYLTLNALTQELATAISSGRIEKIYQPERDEITLSIHSGRSNYLLVISCNAQAPRIHFTKAKKENPSTAPTFCMHLRKLLSGGVIESVSRLNSDRIISITIISKNELKDTVKYSLIFEMMGRYSNIILINENSIIIDAVKQVPFDTATKRCLLPSMKYTCPEQSKILPQDYESIRTLLSSYNGNDLAKFLTGNVSGLALISAEHLTSVVNNTISTPKDIETVIDRLDALYNIYNTKNYRPCVLIDPNGSAVDYFIEPYLDVGGEFSSVETLSDAIYQCVSKRDEQERHREKSKHLYGAIKKYLQRNQKKLDKANEKLQECQKIDMYLQYGELITCNIYKIKRGDEYLETANYYDESSPIIKIPLNKQLSPSKCAQDYFKRYNKLKRTLTLIDGQIKDTSNDLVYGQTIESSLLTCTSVAELYEIEKELFDIGALKKLKTTLPKSIKPAQPFTYEFMEFIIMVGKNNYQNEKLTFKTANGGDLWLHTHDYHGSHVIVFAEARDIPNQVVEFAAQLAGYYSSGRAGDKIAVDYIFRKNLKRHPSGKVGMVTYTDQKTAIITPSQHLEYKVIN